MKDRPSYPDDSPVGNPVGNTSEGDSSADEGKAESGRTRQMMTGAAIGIGSAALVAALLYANRSRKTAKRRD
jgi:hypothetical protein